MKNRNLIILVLILVQSLQTFGKDDRFKNRIRISATPLGYYTYVASEDASTKNYFDGGLNDISLSYEFIPFKKFGFEAFFNFYGYKYRGYRDDPDAFARTYGIPSFTAGICGVFHPLGTNKKIDLPIRYGMGYAHYWVSRHGYYPGFGATASIGCGYKVTRNLVLGGELGAHYSTFSGGHAKNDPSEDRFPFELMSADMGIYASLYF
jgi:hypothetical protein